MHKVLWNAVIKCRKQSDNVKISESIAYCAGCPLGSECAEIDEQERKTVRQVPKFQIENSQSGAPDGEPFEAESLEDAQRIVLEWNGITIREVKKEEKT